MSEEKVRVPMHPIDVIKEWRKGCSCTIGEHPSQCEECTENAMKAIERYFEILSAHGGGVVNVKTRLTGDTPVEELERRMESGFDEYVKTAMVTRELK